MKSTIVPVCALLVMLLTGCPEPPVVSRSVSLSFPVPEKPSKVSLYVSDTEVQEAVKLIDAVLVSNGFVRDQNPDNATVQGFVVSYSKLNNEGLRRLDESPGIYLKDNQLEVIFSEGRNPSGHLSTSTKQMLDLLKNKLSSHYGADKVRVVKSRS
jgi:hypothetical protein